VVWSVESAGQTHNCKHELTLKNQGHNESWTGSLPLVPVAGEADSRFYTLTLRWSS